VLNKVELAVLTVSHSGTEHIVRPRGVGGGFMHLSVQMARHGRYVFILVLILVLRLVLDSVFNCCMLTVYSWMQIKKLPHKHNCASTSKV
jgi:hypothetical protein